MIYYDMTFICSLHLAISPWIFPMCLITKKIAGDTLTSDWHNAFIQVHHRVPPVPREGEGLVGGVILNPGTSPPIFLVGMRYCYPCAPLFWVNPKNPSATKWSKWQTKAESHSCQHHHCLTLFVFHQQTVTQGRNVQYIVKPKKHEAIEWHVVECR